MKKINLALIFGGQSGEHEISLSSALGVISGLNKEKYNIIPIAITKKGNWLAGDKGKKYLELHSNVAGLENGVTKEASQSLVTIKEKNLSNYLEGELGNEKIDLVFPIIHGPFGEDGKLQGMLDMLGVKYVFSGVLAHALAMNKAKAKIIAQSAGVPIAESITINQNKSHSLEKIIEKLNLPLMVKPIELGSSVGISLAKTKEALNQGILDALHHSKNVLLEKYIKGREFTVSVFGNKSPQAFPIVEIIPQGSEFYDFRAKYVQGGSVHICPAEISKEKTEEMQKYAIQVFKALGCEDLARADFMMDEEGNIYFIEINTIPGMTQTSLVPDTARAAQIEFSDFLDKLIEGALKK